jgi:PKD repeat protein
MVIFYRLLNYGEIMNVKILFTYNSRRRVTLIGILLMILIGVSPAAALIEMPGYRLVNLSVVNDDGARFDDNGDDTYNYFSATQSPSQGLNALHLSTDNSYYNFGQVTFSNAQSGVFYMSDTGGRGWDDDGVLMLAVNGTIPANFRIHIIASGYQWAPVDKDTYPSYADITYFPLALDEYFTSDDFTYGPQIWKPCPAENYPIFDGQNMADTTNTFSVMFIDLNAGIIGPNTIDNGDGYDGITLIDNGSIRIEYTLENLQTMAAFDAYAYTVSSNQGQGIRWTNRLSETGASGYSVIGQPPAILTLPGLTRTPTDPDGDGLYEDLNGNGDTDFDDVIVFFKNIEWIIENEPVTAFDFNGSGSVGFEDVVRFFKEV